MSELQGRATFGTIEQIESATITFGPGVTPNAAVITILPQETEIAEYGDMAFSFDGGEHRFVECKADLGQLQRDRSGLVWRISIFDRRWKWKFGQIGGQYNVRNPDNTIKSGTEKTPHELATLCIQAMGEENGGWEIGDLPNTSRPAVRWDCDNPAQALANLCDQLGCIVVPDLDGRTGRLCRAGSGADLPSGGVENWANTFDPPETPTAVAVVCGPDRFEVDFELEPVGEESDYGTNNQEKGTIKLLDDLSYKPAAGWESIMPGDYASIFDAKGKHAKECAEKSVWKWYRIKIPDGGIIVPGYSQTVNANTPITSLDCILLEDRLVGSVEDQVPEAPYSGGVVTTVAKQRRPPAIVWGTWYHAKAGVPQSGNYNNTIDPNYPEESKYLGEFSIDADRRMVVFSKHMYANALGVDGTGIDLAPTAPELYLRTACTLLDPDTRAPVRTYKWRNTGAPYGTDMRIVKHDEIVLGHTADEPTGVNIADVSAELDYYLDAIMEEYKPQTPQQVTYMGLVRFDLDGAIRQVTYELDKSGARTTVARNTEDIIRREPYAQKRARQREKEAIQKLRDTSNKVDDLPKTWNIA